MYNEFPLPIACCFASTSQECARHVICGRHCQRACIVKQVCSSRCVWHCDLSLRRSKSCKFSRPTDSSQCGVRIPPVSPVFSSSHRCEPLQSHRVVTCHFCVFCYVILCTFKYNPILLAPVSCVPSSLQCAAIFGLRPPSLLGPRARASACSV